MILCYLARPNETMMILILSKSGEHCDAILIPIKAEGHYDDAFIHGKAGGLLY